MESAELRFEHAYESLELCLEDPCKWSSSSMIYYRVRELALASTSLAEQLAGTEECRQALDTLRSFTNAHVLAFMCFPPRGPLTVSYAAARTIRHHLLSQRKVAA